MTLSNKLKTQVLILGAGGHARVCFDILRSHSELQLLGVISPNLAEGEEWLESVSCLGGDSDAEQLLKKCPDIILVNGLGYLPNKRARKQVAERFRSNRFLTLRHASAIISSAAEIGEGAQIMAKSCIQYGTKIAEHSIINTGALIDHDCKIGAFCHIAPGSVICGDVTIENDVFIGAGAVVIQGVTIGKGAVIGAGVTIKNNVLPGEWVK